MNNKHNVALWLAVLAISFFSATLTGACSGELLDPVPILGGEDDDASGGGTSDVGCSSSADCGGDACVDGRCSGGSDDARGRCSRDRDCPSGQVCTARGRCAVSGAGDVSEDSSVDDAGSDDAGSDDAGSDDAGNSGDDGDSDDARDSGDADDDHLCVPTCALGLVCQRGVCVEEASDACEPACGIGYTCQDGECIEDDPGACHPECDPGHICQNGQCVSNRCELVASDCSDPDRPYLTYSADGSCDCSGCATDSDCNSAAGEICLAQGGRGRCIYTTGQTCISRCESDGYCQAGQCTECLSEHDCSGSGEVCIRGRCGQCECPAGMVCDIIGNCVDELPSASCQTAADCVGPAQQLGWSGDTSLLGCDQSVGGCYVMGQCNGILGGDDPWGGQCKPSSSCEALLLFLVGIGDGIITKCACDPSRPDMCRTGEDCRADVLGGINYSCQKPGFPFPF